MPLPIVTFYLRHLRPYFTKIPHQCFDYEFTLNQDKHDWLKSCKTSPRSLDRNNTRNNTLNPGTHHDTTELAEGALLTVDANRTRLRVLPQRR